MHIVEFLLEALYLALDRRLTEHLLLFLLLRAHGFIGDTAYLKEVIQDFLDHFSSLLPAVLSKNRVSLLIIYLKPRRQSAGCSLDSIDLVQPVLYRIRPFETCGKISHLLLEVLDLLSLDIRLQVLYVASSGYLQAYGVIRMYRNAFNIHSVLSADRYIALLIDLCNAA